ncbi:MAG: hypothetical protein ABI076_10990 [Acidobacteriaceae bacterium]
MRRFVLFVALAFSFPGFCVVQASHNASVPEGMYLQIVSHKYSLNDPAVPEAIRTSLNSPLSQTFKDAQGRVWEAMNDRLVVISPDDGQERMLTAKDGLPIP